MEQGSVFLKELNQEQREAVQCTEGPVLIVAGAGSGKTRVLTSRIAYLLENGCEPERILALTFTKKAAGEMKERISSMIGGKKAWRICMGTFHSVFVRFLREFAPALNYSPEFTIYDKGDSESALKACIKELGLDDKTYKPRDVSSRISLAKNNLVNAAAYAANREAVTEDIHRKRPAIKDIFCLYEKKCRQSGVMDFDDILLNMNILLRDSPEALESISSRFSHILVDEYQDTNLAQYLIIKKLAAAHGNICVVGDDSQSIYAFRGARIENMLKFGADFKNARVFRLERNYRSTGNIVGAANSVISKNSSRIPKNCFSEESEGERIRLIHAWSEEDEARMIASAIKSRIASDHCEYKDFAILYRTNSQSRAIEAALRNNNLPFMIYSGRSFFDRAEVKDMMAYLKLAVNPDDNEAFKRVVNMPARGIGETSMTALSAAARDKGLSLFRTALEEDLDIWGLKPAAKTRIRAFCELIEKASQKTQSCDAYEVATFLSDESGLYRLYKSDDTVESQSRAANIEELINSIVSHREEREDEFRASMEDDGIQTEDAQMPLVTLQQYLEDISLLSNADTDSEDDGNKIAMMTVHSAKGLEFPYVFVTGMEENLFPNINIMSPPTALEEERRLFYVALTRAMKALSLSFAQTRMRTGKHEDNPPSRFIREIDPKYVANPLGAPESRRTSPFGSTGNFNGIGNRGGFGMFSRTESRPMSRTELRPMSRPSGDKSRPIRPSAVPPIVDPDFVALPMTMFEAGQRVEHNRFGLGTIKEIIGTSPDLKARVCFDNYGEKLLLLKFAKMRFPKD